MSSFDIVDSALGSYWSGMGSNFCQSTEKKGCIRGLVYQWILYLWCGFLWFVCLKYGLELHNTLMYCLSTNLPLEPIIGRTLRGSGWNVCLPYATYVGIIWIAWDSMSYVRILDGVGPLLQLAPPLYQQKNAAYGQQSTLSHLNEIQSKTVNMVKNGQKQFKPSKLVKNSWKCP